MYLNKVSPSSTLKACTPLSTASDHCSSRLALPLPMPCLFAAHLPTRHRPSGSGCGRRRMLGMVMIESWQCTMQLPASFQMVYGLAFSEPFSHITMWGISRPAIRSQSSSTSSSSSSSSSISPPPSLHHPIPTHTSRPLHGSTNRHHFSSPRRQGCQICHQLRHAPKH